MRRFVALALVVAAVVWADRAYACSVCFADPDSSQGQALNAAVWTLMGTTTLVLGGAAAFIGALVLRVRAAEKEGAANA